MAHLFRLSDEALAAIGRHLPRGKAGKPRVDDRRVISGNFARSQDRMPLARRTPPGLGFAAGTTFYLISRTCTFSWLRCGQHRTGLPWNLNNKGASPKILGTRVADKGN
jgi:hypothetical protein